MFSFPTEIVDQIIPHISSKDYSQLVRVGHAYHTRFIPLLYRDISIANPNRFKLFLKERKHHKHVRSIDISRVHVDKDQIGRFPVLFPYLEYYNFVLDNFDDNVKFSQPFSHLISLTIKVGYSEQSLSDILATMPYLKSLCVIDMYYEELEIDLLSDIHELCPYLTDLYIESFLVKEPTGDQFKSLRLHNRLQTFVIKSYGFDHHRLWLRYVATCYPNIEVLVFENKFAHRSQTEPYSAKFYDWFWSSCRRLIHFEAINIAPDGLFLEKLKSQQERLQCRKVRSEYFFWRNL